MQARAEELYSEIMCYRLDIFGLMKKIYFKDVGDKVDLGFYAESSDSSSENASAQIISVQDALSRLDRVSTALHKLENTIVPTHVGAACALSAGDIEVLEGTKATRGLVKRVDEYYSDLLREIDGETPRQKHSLFKSGPMKPVQQDDMAILELARYGNGC